MMSSQDIEDPRCRVLKQEQTQTLALPCFHQWEKNAPRSQHSLEEQTHPNAHLSHERNALTAHWAPSCFYSPDSSFPESWILTVGAKQKALRGSPPCNNKSPFQTPRFKRKHHHSLVGPPVKPINMKLPPLFVGAPRPWWLKWLTFPLQHIFAKLHDSKDTA